MDVSPEELDRRYFAFRLRSADPPATVHLSADLGETTLCNDANLRNRDGDDWTAVRVDGVDPAALCGNCLRQAERRRA